MALVVRFTTKRIVIYLLLGCFLYLLVTCFILDTLQVSRSALSVFNLVASACDTNATYTQIDRSWSDLLYCELARFDANFSRLITTQSPRHSLIVNCSSLPLTFSELLQQTASSCDLNTDDSDRAVSYHSILSLRRRIMILYHLHKQHHQHVFSAMDTQNYHRILDEFKKCEHTNMKSRVENKHMLYHIHLSKAAGKMVRSNLKSNIFDHKLPFEHVDDSMDCNALHAAITGDIRQKYRWIERENSVYDVCDNMIYVMPIREPIERLCSQLSQLSWLRRILDKLSLFRSYASWSAVHQQENKTKLEESCIAQNVSINGRVWKKLVTPRDFQGFFKELLYSEKYAVNPITARSRKKELVTLHSQMTVSIDELTELELPACSDRAKELDIKGRNTYFVPIRYDRIGADPFDSEFILFSRNNRELTLPARIRTKAGSNMYTTWLGFDTFSDCKVIGNYVPRSSIHFGHFWNAVKVLLSLDYVIPIAMSPQNGNAADSRLLMDDKHEWSQVVFDHIYNHSRLTFANDFIVDQKVNSSQHQKTWNVLHSSSLRGTARRMVSSTEICRLLDNEDRDLLTAMNTFDTMLYEIAKLMDKIDVDFLHYTPID